MLSLKSKIPFKILSYREVLIHRFNDTFQSAVATSEASRPVSAALMTRASMETLARIKELKDRLDRFLKLPDSASLDEFLMNRVFGARNDPELPSATNILNSIDKMKDIIPNFRTVYDNLSEYCHPNHRGTFGSFAKIDREEFVIDFEDDEKRQRAMRIILPGLLATFHLFTLIYNEIEDRVRAVNEFYENQN